MTADFAHAVQTNAQAIPVIDVAGAISGHGINGVAQAIDAAAIDAGATDLGFFYIANHGINPIDLGRSPSESAYPPVKAGAHIASRNAKSFGPEGVGDSAQVPPLGQSAFTKPTAAFLVLTDALPGHPKF